MALSAEDRKEVETIIENVVRIQNIDLNLLQQQWRKFKEAPEARLAALEVKVEGVEREVKEMKNEIKEFKTEVSARFEKLEQKFEKRFDEVNNKFDQINKKFDEVNKTLLKLHESMNAQVWKFLGGLGVILILLRLAGAIFPSLP